MGDLIPEKYFFTKLLLTDCTFRLKMGNNFLKPASFIQSVLILPLRRKVLKNNLSKTDVDISMVVSI